MSLEHAYMRQAIELAKQGMYSTHPNPRVGCVIVKNDQIIGQGAHLKAGAAHAEIHALEQAGEKARGATAYVTLEPCSHVGRTGACSRALIQAGVAKVVAGSKDPNPKVSGNGFKMLQEAGIDVVESCLEEQTTALNPGFFKRFQTGKPFVRVKLAMSLDGRTAMASGESKWITGEIARKDVQKLRAQSSAVLTTAKSVLTDDAAMNVRFDEAGIELAPDLQRQPLRVLLDSKLQIDANSRFMRQAGDVLVVTQQSDIVQPQRSEALGVIDYWHHPDKNISTLLDKLAQQNIHELLIESGGTFSGQVIKQGLVDELVVYCAPILLGNLAQALVELPIDKMSDKVRWQFKSVEQLGEDLKLTLTPYMR